MWSAMQKTMRALRLIVNAEVVNANGQPMGLAEAIFR